jgi:energy-coupling factor transporter transmembrane protein EcfT
MSFSVQAGDSLLHRYDPRLKLVMLLAVAMAVHRAAMVELAFLAAGLSLALPVFLSPGQSALKQIVSALRFSLVLLVLSLALGGLSSFFGLLGFSVRLYAWVILGFLYLGTSSVSQIRGTFYSLSRWIPGFPASCFAMMISVALSFLPRLNRALTTGREALASRGGVPWYRPFRKIKSISIPLLLRTVKQSSQLSEALYARGFDENRVFLLGKIPRLQVFVSVTVIAGYLMSRFFFVYLEGYLRLYSK